MPDRDVLGLRLLAALNAGIGAALLVGGPDRTSAASFDVVEDLFPIKVWGVLFLLGAVVVLSAPRLRWGPVLVGVGAGVHAAWFAAFLLGAVSNTSASLTAPVIFGWTTVVHIVTGQRLATRRS